MKPLNIIGLIFFAAGALLLIGFTLYKIIEDTLYSASVPSVVILGVAGVILGIIVMLVSLINERVKDNKKGE